jgi:Protein of unknown function (DUF3159)
LRCVTLIQARAASMIASVRSESGDTDAWTFHPRKRSIIAAIARQLTPHLIEATLIPTVLFYTMLAVFGLRPALMVALAWAYVAIGRRIVRGRRMPAILLLATMGITLRAIVYLCNHNAFVYFLQPILGTSVTAAVLLLSIPLGQPLIARFAHDFCPLHPDVKERPEVTRLFRRLTFLWAGVNAVVAGISLVLLLTVPVGVFVGTKMLTAWIVTCTGIVISVSDAVRTARHSGLSTALSPDGGLHAFVPVPPGHGSVAPLANLYAVAGAA